MASSTRINPKAKYNGGLESIAKPRVEKVAKKPATVKIPTKPLASKPTFAASLKIAIQKAKIDALHKVVGEIEQSLKESLGWRGNTTITKNEDISGKEVTASIKVVGFGWWVQHEGESGLYLDIEGVAFLNDTVNRLSKKHPKFGIGWVAGDDCDIHINIRNCRTDFDTKMQEGFVLPAKATVQRKNQPTDTAIKKAKNELVQEVAGIMSGKLKELRAGRHCVSTSTANLKLKNPTVKIKVKYFGSWSYCPKRERMHIQSFEEQQIKHEVDQLLERYPKFSIEWNTDDKSILSVIVKNQQPPTLAMLKGGLTPAQQKVEDIHLENMTAMKKVAAEIRMTLKAGKNGGKPRRTTSGFGIGGSRGSMGFEAGNDWYENINDKGEVDIGCRDLGGDYQVPREGGHNYYGLEISDSTEKFVNDTVAGFNKKYPKLDIGWSNDEKRWMSVYISVKKSKKS